MYWINGTAKAFSAAHRYIVRPESPPAAISEEGERTVAADDDAPEFTPVIAFQRNRHGTLFVTITTTELHLWSARPTTVIAKVCRNQKSIEDYGENHDIIWKPDSTSVTVVTAKGYLLVYNCVILDDLCFHYNFSTPHHYTPGPGEGQGIRACGLKFRLTIKIDAGVACGTSTEDALMICTKSPPALQIISWTPEKIPPRTWLLHRMKFLRTKTTPATLQDIVYDRSMNFFVWLVSDGRAYFVQQASSRVSLSRDSVDRASGEWSGFCFHGKEEEEEELSDKKRGTFVAVNARFSLIAVGTQAGDVFIYLVKDYNGHVFLSHTLSIRQSMRGVSLTPTGKVTSLAWTSDGYAIAVGWENGGLSVWSVYGRLLSSTVQDIDDPPFSENFADTYMTGVQQICWSQGNHELFILPIRQLDTVGHLYSLPFAKSTVTCQHNHNNVKRGFLQTEDCLMIYTGAEHRDIHTIDPDAIVWRCIPIPVMYIADNWPIRYACISPDGRYIAVAGRRGLAHFSVVSGRWKMFGNQQQEREFFCRGGLLWHRQILIAACEDVKTRSHELRLYSREKNLDNFYMLHVTPLSHPVVFMNVIGNSLLLYLTDNTFYHYDIVVGPPGRGNASLVLQQQLSFAGIVHFPARVRSISWFETKATDAPVDIRKTTLVILIDGKLAMLHPLETSEGDVQYQLTLLADSVEYYWIANRAMGSLQNSLWACTGAGMKLFMNVASSGRAKLEAAGEPPLTHARSAQIALDFYPLSILMDKGIVVGVHQQVITRNTEFALFKLNMQTHLFLHHIFEFLLANNFDMETVLFASCFSNLVYFGHSLEILLHNVLDAEADKKLPPSQETVLSRVVAFIKRFPQALDVIVSCARKTEVALWDYLFSIVGNPRDLFERCMDDRLLKTATSYLIILHTMEPNLEVNGQDTVRLLQEVLSEGDYELAQELVRFLHSIDSSGRTLREALNKVDLGENGSVDPDGNENGDGEEILLKGMKDLKTDDS
ncbi:uncharacterized protein VTP21DRAFT_890 [Calcarisporiella thermophila]|uniref:uncharacterized protein n=1 Tax=Calcarisporiella thermophila TaxID=911321 RepID=UPI0037445364